VIQNPPSYLACRFIARQSIRNRIGAFVVENGTRFHEGKKILCARDARSTKQHSRC
jgi:hypothetical protein